LFHLTAPRRPLQKPPSPVRISVSDTNRPHRFCSEKTGEVSLWRM
jgi:hypothetical protein